MTREEIGSALDDLRDEFFGSRKYMRFDSNGKLIHRTKEEFAEYLVRLRAFFNENTVPDDLARRFFESGVAESYYMAYGHEII